MVGNPYARRPPLHNTQTIDAATTHATTYKILHTTTRNYMSKALKEQKIRLEKRLAKELLTETRNTISAIIGNEDKQKKKNQVDGMISNDKIKNSGEVFVMAQDNKDAQEIYNLNDGLARNTVKQRQSQIEGKEDMMNFKELSDVKLDAETESDDLAVKESDE